MRRPPPRSTRPDTLSPYTTLFRSPRPPRAAARGSEHVRPDPHRARGPGIRGANHATQAQCRPEHFAPVGRHPIRGNAKTTRSEEHTSELQSLMRISYAVFCLKKKKKNTDPKHNRYVQKKQNT